MFNHCNNAGNTESYLNCRLSQWDQKDWKKRLILFAAQVNAMGNATVLLNEVDCDSKDAIVDQAAEVIRGLNNAYEVFKKAYGESEAGNAPEDFTASITSPGAPPVPPPNTAESVLWFQGAWGNFQTVLNRCGQKSPRIADLMQNLGPAGDKLCEELLRSFGEGADTGVRYRSMATFSAVNFPEKFKG